MLRFRFPPLCIFSTMVVGMNYLTAADETPSIEQRLQALDQEIKILKRKAEIEAENAAAKSEAPVRVEANNKDGFLLVSADGAYKLRLGGSAQIEGIYFLNDEQVPKNNTFFVRRVRPYIQGTVARYFDYQLVFDFAGGGNGTVLDANVTAHIHTSLKIQAGRFKTPFGLEYLQSDPVTAFIERGFPTQLAPGRDVGVQVSGEIIDGRVAYQFGIFNGPADRADRDNDSSDDKQGIARFMATPFKESSVHALAGLSFGIAGSYGQDAALRNGAQSAIVASNVPSFVSPGGTQFFAYADNVIAAGEQIRFSPQLYYTWGPWDLLAEYVTSRQQVCTANFATNTILTDAHTITNRAWQIESGYVVTGENASFRGVSPDTGVGSGGWGALQVVARIGELRIDQEIFDNRQSSRDSSASHALALGFGLNWWLNRNLRLMVNYDHTKFAGGGGGTNVNPRDKEDEQVIRSRLQLVF